MWINLKSYGYWQVCISMKAKPCVRSMELWVGHLNHLSLCSWVNMCAERQRLRDFIASVFLDEASILNNNDFLMCSCDYVVMVKYGALGWLGDEGATREILQRHRLQHRPRWSNLHKFKSNLCGPWPCQTMEDSVVLKGKEVVNRRSDMQKCTAQYNAWHYVETEKLIEMLLKDSRRSYSYQWL